MSIGIKYCGGCNPKYNRTNFVKKLINKYKHIAFENYKDNTSYDIVIVICGCESACVNIDKLNGLKKIIVTDKKDYNKVNKMFNELC